MLISARRSSIEPRATEGSRAARTALKAMENVSLMMAGAQLGITICSLGLGYLGEPAIAHFLEGPSYAVGNRLSLADCTLAPLFFFIEVLLVPTFGRPSPLTGKMRAYYDGVSKDVHVAKGLREMQVVLSERQKAAAAQG